MAGASVPEVTSEGMMMSWLMHWHECRPFQDERKHSTSTVVCCFSDHVKIGHKLLKMLLRLILHSYQLVPSGIAQTCTGVVAFTSVHLIMTCAGCTHDTQYMYTMTYHMYSTE